MKRLVPAVAAALLALSPYNDAGGVDNPPPGGGLLLLPDGGLVIADTFNHCLRRIDENLHYPGDLNGEVHHDGQIWSRALWNIRQNLGHVKADTIILQGSFDYPGTTMPVLANSTVLAAQSLYGTSAANVVHRAFADRGIL